MRSRRITLRADAPGMLVSGIEQAELGTVRPMTESPESLRPVPESRMALDWLASYSRERHLETSITRMGQRVREIVPQ